ncbi:acid protease [Laetiporus sulphureus 93-53]|uniref:Acid protease n=1 Tax=Laetiporus sulphureus 93-53 TaxID=1314785 RepID=A0A165F479_9APHY|nr:acid protease [Laetiporus sulphureus 93-53]KZT08350.1 acid protease [Laetiporus sulphureus 93-53]
MRPSLLSGSLLLYLCFLIDDWAVSAVRVPVARRRVDHGNGASMSSAKGGLDLKDAGDLNYYTNVLIDTGSADLWVAGNVPGVQSTGKTATIDYAIGSADGRFPRFILQVYQGAYFDEYTVEDQAFVSVTPDSSHPSGQGTIGLGPNSDSPPNILTILLGRSDDTTNPFPGELTIGRVLEGYENVTAQPKLVVHWQTLLGKDGSVAPGGEIVQVQSVVEGLDQLVVVFDSGFSLPQVPSTVADAFYSRVPGTNFTICSWCWRELNITFKFGGINFPVNPLDASLAMFNERNADGEPVCVSSFHPITSAASSEYDMILGMAFLRNAYLLVDFGDFVDGSSSQTAEPYIQLLSTTDPAQAHQDFVQERLGGVDNTSSFHLLPASASNMSQGNDSSNTTDASLAGEIKPYVPYIIAGSVALGIFFIVMVAYFLTRPSRKAYQRLHEPAPAGLHYEQPPFPRYERPYRRY